MPQFKNLRSYDELPPHRPHYKAIRARKRVLIIARNSRKGKWTRWGSYPTKITAESQGSKLRYKPDTRAIGKLSVTVRPDPLKAGYWLVFAKFTDLHITDHDLEENIIDAGGHEVLDQVEVAGDETETD